MLSYYCGENYSPGNENWRITSERSTNLRQKTKILCTQQSCEEWNDSHCPYKI